MSRILSLHTDWDKKKMAESSTQGLFDLNDKLISFYF